MKRKIFIYINICTKKLLLFNLLRHNNILDNKPKNIIRHFNLLNTKLVVYFYLNSNLCKTLNQRGTKLLSHEIV